ncbi:MAG: alpha-glucan family phosphorylase [Candidatus Micrarchaeota archaeon]|nr:alpha-glucan family phosphorylase [Candidatus Micrarchaeota archaeon]
MSLAVISLPDVDEDIVVAYFTMEIGLTENMPTYAGGLGILAGDVVKTFADLKVPAVAVTMLNEKGYFRQVLDDEGNQTEENEIWDKNKFMKPLPNKVVVTLEGRSVVVRAWEHYVESPSGGSVPVYFLDTDVPENTEYDRTLTSHLYGGDSRYRIMQEAILGIGGLKLLVDIGYENIENYHMNEGHAAFLILELLNRTKNEEEKNYKKRYDFDKVKEKCVFTTHTPLPAGHDSFDTEMVKSILGADYFPFDNVDIPDNRKFSMTYLALNHSHYINGVAKRHKDITSRMFPGYRIHSITNGAHSATWVSEPFRDLYNKYIPNWSHDPFSLRYVFGIPKNEIWEAHIKAKENLFNLIKELTGETLDINALTMGFARRMTGYKRPTLIFRDIERLNKMAASGVKLQLIFAGKAHPKDIEGKEIIKELFRIKKRLGENIKFIFLENYGMKIAKQLISGVDIWLNTPQRPFEASGTSGMKASHNGVVNFSVLDGWWIEGYIEKVTGWSIGPKVASPDHLADDRKDAEDLYNKLEKEIMLMFYRDRERWIEIMKHSIAINASFFNTHRMVQQYVMNAYI